MTIFLSAASICLADSNSESQTIGSLSVSPLDYDKYADTIDLKLLRYFESSQVLFYDSSVKTYSNDTKTVSNATILSTGQFLINNSDGDYYLTIDPTSGVVKVTPDSSANNGLFFINDNYLYFQYHKIFVACKTGADAHDYTLTWRGASSPAVCENDWLLVYLKPYGSSSGSAISSYHPNEYVASIASTASDNTDTSTVTAPVSTGSSSSSKNVANGQLIGGDSGITLYSGLSVLLIALFSLIN